MPGHQVDQHNLATVGLDQFVAHDFLAAIVTALDQHLGTHPAQQLERRILLEYDDERSGSFEPLANVPDDKVVVLGPVSSKLPEFEPAGELIARIDEAARYVGKERLALSTQCGFSPVSIGGNLISEETQQRKLELVAEVAHQVW